MNNLNTLSKLSESEFLSFLYSERGRYRDKNSKSGWSIWAISGSIFALVYYIYKGLRECDGNVDLRLCYYIVCAFLPPVLYVTYLIERKKGFDNGDSRHIARLIDVAPIWVLSYLGVVYLLLLITGMYFDDNIVAVFNAVALVPVLTSLVVIIWQRNRLVTTIDRFSISSTKWLNNTLLIAIGGTIIEPTTCAGKHLALGFSFEFEIAIAIVTIIALTYLLFKMVFSQNIEHEINNIIEAYLFSNWKKEAALAKIEEVVLGRRPTDELQVLYDRMSHYEESIPALFQRFDEIDRKLQEKCIGEEEFNLLDAEIQRNLSEVQSYLNTCQDVLSTCNELVYIKGFDPDKEFQEILCILLNTNTYDGTNKQISKLQNRMLESMQKLKQRCAESICLNKDCPQRHFGKKK